MGKSFEDKYKEINRPYSEAEARFMRTFDVYMLLKECGESLQPKEIAERLGWTYNYDPEILAYDTLNLRVGDAAGAVRRLWKMGLVTQERFTQKLTVATYVSGIITIETEYFKWKAI